MTYTFFCLKKKVKHCSFYFTEVILYTKSNKVAGHQRVLLPEVLYKNLPITLLLELTGANRLLLSFSESQNQNLKIAVMIS